MVTLSFRSVLSDKMPMRNISYLPRMAILEEEELSQSPTAMKYKSAGPINPEEHVKLMSSSKADDFGADVENLTEPVKASWFQRSSAKQQALIGVAIVLGISVCWVGSTQLAKSALAPSTGFAAPFFLVWFNTIFMTSVFPIYSASIMIFFKITGKGGVGATYKHALGKSVLIFGPNGLCLRAFVLRIAPFTVLWLVANYTYSQALAHISATETMALFSSNIAFVYLLSWIFLHERFVGLRIFGILMSITGIVLMAHGKGIGTFTFIGVVLAVVASGTSAIYKVAFKHVAGEASLGQVSIFLSFLGLCDLLALWPVTLSLLLTNTEPVVWSTVPWGFICGAAVLSLCFNFLLNLGVAFTHPILVSVGLFLGTPLNGVIDIFARQESMKPLEIVGGALILVSFILILLPPDFGHNLLVKFGFKSPQSPSNDLHNNRRTNNSAARGVPQLVSSKNVDHY